MTYKLAGKLGETAAIGCCPGSLSYLRTKLRTARRIEVCLYNDIKKLNFMFCFHILRALVWVIVV